MATLGGGEATGYYEMEDEEALEPSPAVAPRTFPRRRHGVPLPTLLAYVISLFLATLDVNLLPSSYSMLSHDIPGLEGSEWDTQHTLKACHLLAGLFAALVTGFLVDCFSRHFAFAAVVVVSKSASLLLHYATNFAHLQLGYTLTGVTCGALLPWVGSLVGDLFPVSSRTSMFGLWAAALMAGPLAGQYIGMQLAAQNGWRLPFLVLAVPGLAAALLMLILLEPLRATQEEALGLEVRSGAHWTYNRPLTFPKLVGLFTVPTNMLLLAQALLTGLPVAVFSVLPSYLTENLGMTAAQAEVMVTLYLGTQVIGIVLGGLLGQEIYHHARTGLPVVAGFALLFAIATSLVLFHPPLSVVAQPLQSVAALVAGIGALIGASQPIIQSLLLNVNRPETRGSILGFYTAAQTASHLAGPVLVAVIIAQCGGNRPQALIMVCAGWALSAILVLLVAFAYKADEAALQEAMVQAFELESEMQDMMGSDTYDPPSGDGRWRPGGRGTFEDALAADIAAAAQADFAAYPANQAARGSPGAGVPRTASQESIVSLGEATKCAIPRTHSW